MNWHAPAAGRWVVALAAGAALLLCGPTNLASIAWSHRVLAGTRPPNYPAITLRDSIAAGGPLAETALATGPPNPLFLYEPWRQQAMVALVAGQPAQARTALHEAFARADAPARRMIYESLLVAGETAAGAGRRGRARDAFTLLIGEMPQRTIAYVRLGELQRTEQLYGIALATFRQAVATPDTLEEAPIEKARAYFWIGVLADALGRPAEADQANQDALRSDPTNAGWYWAWNACMALGRSAAGRGAGADAARWYQTALRLAVTPEQRAQAGEQLTRLGGAPR